MTNQEKYVKICLISILCVMLPLMIGVLALSIFVSEWFLFLNFPVALITILLNNYWIKQIN